jgi:hypothetical protein
MTTTLHATPYNIEARGFYFEAIDEFEVKSTCHLDRYGNIVEEFEIQFIDGLDAQLFEACSINQANLNTWFNEIEFLKDYEKVSLYFLVSQIGYTLEQALEKLDEPSITESNLHDAAEALFDECYLHLVPENIRYYINYEKFANDCKIGGDLSEFEYNGSIHTCTNASAL